MRDMRKKDFSKVLILLATSALVSLGSGCSTVGVLMGNEKPIDQKSDSYGVLDLSKADADWSKLDPKTVGDERPNGGDTISSEISDVAYQSKSTAAIISLNSACQAGKEYENKDLKSLTDTLLLGASDVTLRDEQGVTIQDNPALQTTVEGKMNGEHVKLRTVVLRRQDCVYDLVYIARPEAFPRREQDFSHFVASLRLK
jgi:hypothetical protein